MALLGSRISVASAHMPSNAATLVSMAHSLPGAPNLWGWNNYSAAGAASGGIPITFHILSGDATHLYIRADHSHNVRKHIRVWAEIVHSISR